MRAFSLLIALPTLVALLAGALPATGQATQETTSPPAAGQSDLAHRLLDLGSLQDDAFSLDALNLYSQHADGPTLSYYMVEPESIFRNAEPVCDLDGDGARDLVSNDMQLRRNGRFDSGFSTLRALSGADGHELWQQDNQLYYNIALANAYSAFRPGQPNPVAPPNMVPMVDVNGDGVCDVLAYGFDGNTIISEVPIFGGVSVTIVTVTVRALSGKDGGALWTLPIAAQDIEVTDPIYGTVDSRTIRNFPTGFLLVDGADGPRLVVKTTDLEYEYANDFTQLSAPLVDGDMLWATAVSSGEHVNVIDANDGTAIWTRDYPISPDADNVNMTWISGVQDVTGDGTADVVLDQFTLTNPRGSEVTDPTSDNDLFRYGRIDGWAFDLEILALARRTGFAIAEVGVEWTDDRRSRVNPLRDMWKVMREALTIRKNLRRGVYNPALPAAA